MVIGCAISAQQTINMISERLKEYTLILASGSPRRHRFFKDMGLRFEVRLKSVEEVYPSELKGAEISDYLATLKAQVFKDELKPNDILITSDTVVWHNDESLSKPEDFNDAEKMLKKLSGDWHQVITSVCFTTNERQKVLNSITEVKFKDLSLDEIQYLSLIHI